MSKITINIGTFIFLLLCVASCRTMGEEDLDRAIENTLRATIGAETKTVLEYNESAPSKVVWEKKDEIAVFIDDNRLPKRYALVSGENTTNGIFSGSGVGKQYLGVYPYEAVKEAISGEEVLVDLPQEQGYNVNSFGHGNNPMVAISYSTDLIFYNVCSLIRLSIKGSNVVNKIVFSTNDEDVFVAGPAKVRIGQNGFPEMQMEEGGYNSVSLITGGVELKPDTYTDFYLALPPQNYIGGFTVTIQTPTGFMRKSIERDFVLERSKIHSATPFVLHLDEGVEPSSSLKGLGTRENPFLIGSLSDLLYMRQKINTEDIGLIIAEDESLVPAMIAHYKLTSDIDLSPVCGESQGADWEPIGNIGANMYYIFDGYFDGDNHCITNLYINNESEYQGLFGSSTMSNGLYYPDSWYKTEKYNLLRGKNYAQEHSEVRNLTVKGKVSAFKYVSLISTVVYDVSNCKSYGTVIAKNEYGLGAGIAIDANNVSRCDNFAEIRSAHSASGVIYGHLSSCDPIVESCTNYGSVSCDYEAAGIVHGASLIVNCVNYGKVSGKNSANGISAVANSVLNCMNYGEIVGEGAFYSHRSVYDSKASGLIGLGSCSRVVNCFNAGKVIAISNVCGIINSAYGLENNCAEVTNCLNVGDLFLSDMGYSNAGKIDDSSGCIGIGNYGANIRLTNNYWLYDEINGVGNKDGLITTSTPTNVLIENNTPLNIAQIKGLENNSILYISESGGAYTNLVKALNAWAYEHSISDGVDYSGWTLSSENGYPTLTMQKATMPEPDEVAPYFDLNTMSADVMAEGEYFNVDVSTNRTFEITPEEDWVVEVGREKLGYMHTSITFYAKPNPENQIRETSLIFKVGSNENYSVKVTQQPHPEWYISLDYSKDGEVKILSSASKGNGIDIILMGDGFSDRQIEDGTYYSIMSKMMNSFFSVEPYKTYGALFNVYYVNVISTTEGYEHDGQRLGTQFGEGTHIEGDNAAVLSYAKKAIGEERLNEALIIVALNSDRHAGTCYMFSPDYGDIDGTPDYSGGTTIAYCSTEDKGDFFAETIHHEAGGHGFAKLADEYYYEEYGRVPSSKVESTRAGQKYGWYKNIDFTSNPNTVKWNIFLEDARYSNDGLGVFEGAMTYPYGVYRPTENSIMRYNTGGFNAPSRQAIWYRIHKLAYGSSWVFDYESFVDYDSINRMTATKAIDNRESNYVVKQFQPLAPPVVVGGFLKEK